MHSFVSLSTITQRFEHGLSTVHAIRDVNMHIGEGEIVTLVGPSGCGKTTLLRIVAGLLEPNEGEVRVGGASPTEYRRTHGVGFVFQKPVLFPWRTIRENVLLPTELSDNTDAQSCFDYAQQLLERLALRGFESVYPSQLSGGMLQRAAVARSLMLQPKLLLLDEPFSALDELTREQLWIDFRSVWNEQALTVILVTHSIREAVFLGDRVLVMSSRPGHIVSEVDVSLPEHREHQVVVHTQFTDLCEEVRARLVRTLPQ